jgi:hypothetical protein
MPYVIWASVAKDAFEYILDALKSYGREYLYYLKDREEFLAKRKIIVTGVVE